jgi:hypothetical protein
MTHEEKIKYMQIAMGVCCFGFKPDQLDLLVSIYELIITKEGEANLRDISVVKREVQERYEALEPTELDKP